jgi:ECF transporter S component (folate family)
LKQKGALFTTKALANLSLLTALSIILSRVLGISVPIAGYTALKINFSAVPLILSGICWGPAAGFMSGAVADVVGYMLNPAGGAYFPGFTLSTALCGFIPGVIFRCLRSNKKAYNFKFLNAILAILLIAGAVAIFIYHGQHMNNGLISPKHRLLYGYTAVLGGLALAYMFLLFFPKAKGKDIHSLYSLDKIFFAVVLSQITTSLILNTWFLSIIFSKGFLFFLPARILNTLFMIPVYTLIIHALLKREIIKNL